jgi:Protein of unknown function (DUF2934)
MSQQLFVGRLDIDSHGDSWLLQTARETVLVDVADFNLLNHQALIEGNVVSILGRFGIPRSATTTKLIVRHMVGHDTVRARAFDIWTGNRAGSPVDHWLQAERELLKL